MPPTARPAAPPLVTALLALALAPAAGCAEGPAELGEVTFHTSARSPEAREHFRRATAALHSFWYDEAADAFRAAREAEPGFAMATWGEAMTCNHPIWNQVDVDCGRTALAALAPTPAERAAQAPTSRERAWLGAVEALFGAGDKEARDRAYETAMAALAREYPDDPEAAIFHALSLEGLVYGEHLDAEQRFPVLMRAAALLEDRFAAAPRHPGVLHYLIHAYDDPTHAPLGLRAARLYAETAPAAHHALHMPSHIFVQLGRWAEAAASNEEAWTASVAWTERRGLGRDKRDFHSLSWLLYTYLQQGRLARAREVLDTARGELAAAGDSPRIRGSLAGMEARYRIETGSPAPGAAAAGGTGGHGAHGGAGHGHGAGDALFAAGLDALAAGDPAGLDTAAAALATDGGTVARVMAAELEGLAHLARGQAAEAVARLTEAAALEAGLAPPSGPPDPPKPAHELLGETLLGLDRPADAAAAFTTSLRRTPRRPASLLGAARAAAAAGDEEAARRYGRELLEVWSAADPGLAGLGEARRHAEAGGERREGAGAGDGTPPGGAAPTDAAPPESR